MTAANTTVLVADDDQNIRRFLEYNLKKAGFGVLLAKDGREAVDLASEDISVVLLDLNMPVMSGLQCLEAFKREQAHLQTIVITASGEVNDAVEAMKKGAFDYVTKPFNPEKVISLVRQAARTADLTLENKQLRQSMGDVASQASLIGHSPLAEQLRRDILKVARLDSTVMVTGPSGAGKGLIARMIHNSSSRAGQPFVQINCTALPRELVESELFGHERGAFTGAVERRLGRVEMADGGTLFLDEIGDMPIDVQPKLLTFLQERIFQRIGGNKDLEANVRVIAATNQDLQRRCQDKLFRDDLYYRLNVLPLEVPSLAQRFQDIPVLCDHFLGKIAKHRAVASYTLTEQARNVLAQYAWPGNVRELENVMERSSAFCDNHCIDVKDLPADLTQTAPSPVVVDMSANFPADPSACATSASTLAGLKLSQIEKMALEQTLDACGGNKSEAARMLGISEKSVYNKMDRYGMRQ